MSVRQFRKAPSAVGRGWFQCIGLAAILCLSIPLNAQDWISLRSEHFQLHGNTTERELRDVALRLEQFREVIGRLYPTSVRDGDAAVIAMVFRDDRSFRPFMPRANGRVIPSSGVFASSLDASYIGLSLDAGAEAYPVIFHEYLHYLLRTAFGGVPLWLNEGLAEYYSTFEVTADGRSARLGRPHERHIALLRERRLPLARLLAIGRNSAEYTRDIPDRSVLYAQAWVLVHHAFHGEPRRQDQLITLARRIAAGGEPDSSLRETYGLSLADLDRELQAYVRRPIFQYTNIDFTERVRTALDARAAPADATELDTRRGGLALSAGNLDEASRRLERAVKARPDVAYVHSSLASMRLRQGRGDEANAHLQKARELGGQPTLQIRLTESEARALAPELVAKLEATLRDTTPAPPVDVNATPPEPPRPRPLLTQLGAGDRASFGTLEAIECRPNGITVVVSTPDGPVRARAARLSDVNFITFRSTTQVLFECGKQTPVPARLVWRQQEVSPIAIALELLPDGYVP